MSAPAGDVVMRAVAAKSGEGRPRVLGRNLVLATSCAVGAVVAALGQVALLQQRDVTPGLWLLLGGGMAVVAAVILWARDQPIRWMRVRCADGSTQTAGQLHPGRAAWLLVLVLGLTAAALWAWAGFGNRTATIAALAWMAGVVLAGAVFARAIVCSSEHRAPALAGRPAIAWRLALLLLLLAALALRLYQVAEIPYGIWYDEAEMGLEARRLAGGAPYEPLSHNFGADPSLLFYLIGAVSLLVGDSLLTVRSVVALCGALGAPAAAMLGRELFGWRLGLVTGALVAADRWHLNFSRFGMTPITAPLIATLSLWLLARAVRRRGWADAGLAGLAVGLIPHLYAGARPLLVALPIVFALAVVAERWPLRMVLARGAVILATALLVALPVVVFAVGQPEVYGKRSSQVSIFAQKPTLPAQIEAVVESTKKHLLMFHFRGDRNGRHNVPGMPMVDPIVGVPLVLGLLWCVWNARNWRYAALLLWGGGSLAAGILSLDFEAPQGARTIAVVPALALLSALGLLLLLERACIIGRMLRLPRAPAVVAAVAVVALGAVTWRTADVYFARQMPGSATWLEFSTKETIVARELQRLGAEFPVVLADDRLLGNPVYRFLVPEHAGLLRGFDPVRALPLRNADAAALIFVTDQQQREEILRFYPEATVRQFAPPRDPGTVVLSEIAISPETTQARRGLQARYRAADGSTVSTRVASVDADWRSRPPPLPLPLRAEWLGGLVIERSGTHVFAIPRGFTLSLDGRSFAAADHPDGLSIHLAQGNHTLRLVGEVTEAGEVRLRWRTPEDSDWQPIPDRQLFVGLDGGTGLLGRLYGNPEWSGAPAEERIEPVLSIYYHELSLRRPRSVEWTGELDVPNAGQYRIGVQQVSAAEIWIDELQVLVNHQRNAYQDAAVELTEGRHKIRVRLLDVEGGSHIYLFWTPPGGRREIIPGRNLYPPAPALVQETATATGRQAVDPPERSRVASEAPNFPAGAVPVSAIRADRPTLGEPRGVAVGADGTLYVADVGRRAIVALPPAGGPARFLAEGQLREPVDVALLADGSLAVLDAALARVQRLSLDGQLGEVLAPEQQLYAPRGLSASADGRLIVADTGHSRLVIVAPGQPAFVVAGLDQPTDADFLSDGSLIVAETGADRLTVVRPDGQRLASWPMPEANTLHGPHVAALPDGGWIATAPEEGLLLRKLAHEPEPRHWLTDPRWAKPVGIALGPAEIVLADPESAAIITLTPP